MGCLEEHQIVAVANGELQEHERDAIERHLDGCPTCLALVADAARYAAASAATVPGDAGGAPAPADPWDERYELREQIASGGMGRIFAAYDRKLRRMVAVKCAREAHPLLEARFAREVQLTARLQHPTIIGIHDSGRLRDGRAFYAMPRILGQPLDRRIAAATTLDERLGLLPHVIALVDAVAYVHDQGILHRDLKPHNVLVGGFGETVLVDWGLAKTIADVEAGAPAAEDPELATAAGSVVGTRGYMAPEQAMGLPVDRRSDVYGLGATLLHLITGRPPVGGSGDRASAHGTGRAVTAGGVGSKAPVDLLAIAGRAMATEPDDRYASARELADDLHRFETGRLVQAHHYSPGQLVRRWVNHHRGLVLFAAAALAAVTIISVAAIRGMVSERWVAQSERKRAEDQRDAAQGLVRFALGELRDQLDQVGRLDALSAVAVEIAAYYERVSSWANRPSDLQQRAAAFGLLGEVRRARAEVPGAVTMLRQSVALAREAARQDPSAAADQELCRALLLIGESGRDVGLPEAAAALAESEQIARRWLGTGISGASSAAFRLLLARAVAELGKDAQQRGDIADARRRFEQAQQLGDGLEADGDSRGARSVMLGASALGRMLMERGDWGAAAAPTEKFLAAAQREVANRPHDIRAKTSLALAWQQTGDIHNRGGQFALAEQAYQQGYRIATAVVALEPDNMRWLRNLSAFEESLAFAARARGDLATAITHAIEARNIAAKLAERDPAQIDPQTNLAAGELFVGDNQRAMGQLAEARRSLERALAIAEQVQRTEPSHEGARNIAIILLHVGRVEIAAGRRDAAREALERSAAGTRNVLAAGDDPEARRCLVEVSLELARVVPERRAAYLQDAYAMMAPLRALATSDRELAELAAEVDRARGAGPSAAR